MKARILAMLFALVIVAATLAPVASAGYWRP
jgi:hypothetical protein